MQSNYRENDEESFALASASNSTPTETESVSVSESSVMAPKPSSSGESAGVMPQPQLRRRTIMADPADSNSNTPPEDETSQRARTELPKIYNFCTTLALVCLFVFPAGMFALCFRKWEFFSWHPLLLTIGWMYFTYEAVLAMNKTSFITTHFDFKKAGRIRVHWVAQVAALVCIVPGFVIAVVHKSSLEKPHFETWHGTFGLFTIMALVAPLINGVFVLYPRMFEKYGMPRDLKFFHRVAGCAALALGGSTVILSLYSAWFKQKTDGNEAIFSVALVSLVYIVVWTLVRPVLKLIPYIKLEK